MTRVTTSPMTNNTAAPASTHSQRGVFGGPGCGGSGWGGGAWYCVWVQYGGSGSVGWGVADGV